MGQMAEAIIAPARIGILLAERLVSGVSPQIFARKPSIGGTVVNANHAAFNFGHLALYPSRWLAAVGMDGTSVAAPAGFDDLFAAGKECRDDAEGTIYPPMHEVMNAFYTSHRGALELLRGVEDAKFSLPNPREQSRDRLPTVGAAMIFYTSAHIMMHLGQVSTWRRCFGLGPVK